MVHDWFHVASAYDGGAVRIFINGMEVGEFPRTGTIRTNDEPVHVGCDGPKGGAPLDGELDGEIGGLRVWSRALSNSELTREL